MVRYQDLNDWYTKNICNGATANIGNNSAQFRLVFNTRDESLILPYEWYWLGGATYGDGAALPRVNKTSIWALSNGSQGIRIVIELKNTVNFTKDSNQKVINNIHGQEHTFDIWKII